MCPNNLIFNLLKNLALKTTSIIVVSCLLSQRDHYFLSLLSKHKDKHFMLWADRSTPNIDTHWTAVHIEY